MKWYAILLGAAIGVLGGIAVGYFLIPHLLPRASEQSAESALGAVPGLSFEHPLVQQASVWMGV